MRRRKRFVGVQYIETVRDGDKTIAFGIYYDAKIGRVPFAGVAEKNPNDHENVARGRNFAIGRALEKLGKDIQKQEWSGLKGNQKRASKAPTYTPEEIAVLRARAKARKLLEELSDEYETQENSKRS